MLNLQTLTDGSIIIELADMDDWEEFVMSNYDDIIAQYGSQARAFRHCIDGGLLMGGGASPEVGVYFSDAI